MTGVGSGIYEDVGRAWIRVYDLDPHMVPQMAGMILGKQQRHIVQA